MRKGLAKRGFLGDFTDLLVIGVTLLLALLIFGVFNIVASPQGEIDAATEDKFSTLEAEYVLLQLVQSTVALENKRLGIAEILARIDREEKREEYIKAFRDTAKLTSQAAFGDKEFDFWMRVYDDGESLGIAQGKYFVVYQREGFDFAQGVADTDCKFVGEGAVSASITIPKVGGGNIKVRGCFDKRLFS